MKSIAFGFDKYLFGVFAITKSNRSVKGITEVKCWPLNLHHLDKVVPLSIAHPISQFWLLGLL